MLASVCQSHSFDFFCDSHPAQRKWNSETQEYDILQDLVLSRLEWPLGLQPKNNRGAQETRTHTHTYTGGNTIYVYFWLYLIYCLDTKLYHWGRWGLSKDRRLPSSLSARKHIAVMSLQPWIGQLNLFGAGRGGGWETSDLCLSVIET